MTVTKASEHCCRGDVLLGGGDGVGMGVGWGVTTAMLVRERTKYDEKTAAIGILTASSAIYSDPSAFLSG